MLDIDISPRRSGVWMLFTVFLIILLITSGSFTTLTQAQNAETPTKDPYLPNTDVPRTPIGDSAYPLYGATTLTFEENKGQYDSRVKFVTSGGAYVAFLTDSGVIFSVIQPFDPSTAFNPGISPLTPTAEQKTPEPPQYDDFQFSLIDMNKEFIATGEDKKETQSDYFQGTPDQWTVGVSHFGRVRYTSVYEGIDLVFYGNSQWLQYDFEIMPGRDYRQIRLLFEGMQKLELDVNGDLLIHIGTGETERVIRKLAPIAYQVVKEQKQIVGSRYVLDGNELSFSIDEYDSTLPLIIDPFFMYSGYAGGVSQDTATSIALDSQGNAYITGYTYSLTLQFIGSIGTTSTTTTDIFVAKIKADGTEALWTARIGGNSIDYGTDIAVDSQGNAYITGYTGFTDTSIPFPTYLGPDITPDLDPAFQDAVICKIASNGSTLIYSGYIGGSGTDLGWSLTVDSSGNAYVTGSTTSTSRFPLGGSIKNTNSGNVDGFVTKVLSSGLGFGFSGFLGGLNDESGLGITLDPSGSVYVVGGTYGQDFPITPPPLYYFQGSEDTFITKLNPNSGAMSRSTYFGGDGNEQAESIAIDGLGYVYVVGRTNGGSFPIAVGPDITYNGGSYDCFVSKLTNNLDAVLYSGFIGTNADEQCVDVAVNAPSLGDPKAHVTGYSQYGYAPILNMGPDFQTHGNSEALIARVNVQGSGLDFIGNIGGNLYESGEGIAIDASGFIYAAGYMSSPQTTFQTTVGPRRELTATDAFVVKLNNVNPPSGPSPDTIGVFRSNAPNTYYLRFTNTTGAADLIRLFQIPNIDLTGVIPVIGDWNGDGIETLGVYKRSTGEFFLRNSNANGAPLAFSLVFGGGPSDPTDIPIAGDWNGDGKDTVGIFRNTATQSTFYLIDTLNTSSNPTYSINFGNPGDKAIVGDWNGDGNDTPGIFRPSGTGAGIFYLSNIVCNCTVTIADYYYNAPNWQSTDLPFAGDWDGNRFSGVALFRPSTTVVYMRNDPRV